MTIANKFLLTGYSLSLCLSFVGCGGSNSSPTSADSTSESLYASSSNNYDRGEDDDDDKNDNTNQTSIVLPISYTPNAGRLLGSQCAQCHGTNGVSSNNWDSIAGEDELESEIYEDDEPIMSAQARGYTTDEISLISNWLKTLKH